MSIDREAPAESNGRDPLQEDTSAESLIDVRDGHDGSTAADPASSPSLPWIVQTTSRTRRRWVRPAFASVAVLGSAAVLTMALQSVLSSAPAASGYLVPASTVQLNFQSAAPVLAVDVHPGQYVHAGEVLATQDTTPLQAKLAADESTLTADQQKLSELQSQSGSTAGQPQLTPSQATLQGAQQNANDTALADATAVAKAQAAVQNANLLLSSDQQQVSSDAAACASVQSVALPPPGQPAQTTNGSQPALTAADEIALMVMCQNESHQLAQDQAQLATAQAAYQQAVATSKLDADNSAATVSIDQAQVTLNTQSQPGTVAAAQAAVESDMSAIKADQAALAGAVLRAPFGGLVAAVGGVTGDIASTDGVHQFTPSQPLPSQPQSSIELFPSAPSQQSTPVSEFASMITLDSPTMKVEAQVSESDIGKVHVGQVVHIRIPAFPNTNVEGKVASIDPAAVNSSGKVSYLVDVALDAPLQNVQEVADKRGTKSPPAFLPGLSADVSF